VPLDRVNVNYHQDKTTAATKCYTSEQLTIEFVCVECIPQ